jgi:hypothetical protein
MLQKCVSSKGDQLLRFTIHLGCCHFFVGSCGVKNWPNLLTDNRKKCQRSGVEVKNYENLRMSSMDGGEAFSALPSKTNWLIKNITE